MPVPIQKIRVFVASPDDVRSERDQLGHAIEELNTTLGHDRGVVVELIRWETHGHPGMGRPQQVFNEQVGEYDVFIGIMWKRFGTPTGEAQSGTEEEFRLAYRAWEEERLRDILFYFCEQPWMPGSADELEQMGKVLEFRNSLRNGKALVWSYTDRERFADVVRPHLARVLAAMLSVPGDVPEVAEQKLDQARRLIADEVMARLVSIDARLGFVAGSVAPDPFEGRLREAKRKVAPSAEAATTRGYRQLMAETRISSLRHAFNAHPLRGELGGPMVDVLVGADADVGAIRLFYDQLAEVDWASESLFAALAQEAGEEGRDTPAWQEYVRTRTELAVATLRNRSERAHLAALRVLDQIGPADEVAARLAALAHLRPNRVVPPAEADALLAKNVADQEEIVARKTRLKEDGERLLEAGAREIEEVNTLLEIRDTDTWNEVVGKAVSLRHFGRIAEAMAAFHRYGQLFSPTDATAARYADTAMAFTQQLQELDVEGGVYVFRVGEGSVATAAGVEVGDLIVEYNGRAVPNMPEMVSALAETHAGDYVRATVLRLDRETGRFSRRTVSVEGGALGAGLMPI